MKICVHSKSGLILSLKRHFELEGDTLVSMDKADLIVTDESVGERRVPIVGGDINLPLEVTQAMGFSFEGDMESSYFFTCWFDWNNGWGEQVFVGIPLKTMLSHNMGYPAESGVVGRYVPKEKVTELFSNQNLEVYLRESRYTGPISILLNSRHSVISVESWVPSTGLFNILEGLKDKISLYLSQPESVRMYESWTASILVTRCPFPYKTRSGKVNVEGITRKAEKHVWLYKVDTFGTIFSTVETVVGVVSTWGQSLNEAARRARGGVLRIVVPLKQARLDLEHATLDRWDTIKSRWLHTPSSHDHQLIPESSEK